MKKHLFRVKQLADQTFLGADKSERLNHEELQEADHKVEYLRSALLAVSKKIPPVNSSNAQGTDHAQQDKRMKKFPEYQLGQVMLEQSSKEGKSREQSEKDDLKLLQPVLLKCGRVQQDLARDQADHEIKVEQWISLPLQTVLETELPNIRQQKKNLSKLILDKDSATNRFTAHKNGTQKEALRDEMEEADIKVEQSRDALAAEMFSLLRRESEFAQYMLQLLKLQRAYHEVALKNLEAVIPDLEKEIGDSSVKTVYGCSLKEHLRVTDRKIAYPLELCVCALNELGMSEEGLFRVAGGVARVRRLKLSIDSGCFTLPLLFEYQDVHVIANALKSYLRELPEPLLTDLLYNEWMHAAKLHTEELRVKAIQEALKKLPLENRDNLSYLIHFLVKLSKTPNNKMTAQNISIVFAPNLLWKDDQNVDAHMSNCTVVNMIVEIFINHVDKLFPDEPQVYLTIRKGDIFSEFCRPNITVLNNYPPPSDLHGSDLLMSQSAHFETSSPRPTTRKKNKPAPTPPVVASSKADNGISGAVDGRAGKEKQYYQHQEVFVPDMDRRRLSLDGDNNVHLESRYENRNAVKLSVNPDMKPSSRNPSLDALTMDALDISYGHPPPSADPIHHHHVAQPKHIQRITAQNTNVERITITSDNVQQKSSVSIVSTAPVAPAAEAAAPPKVTKTTSSTPVPAPRVSLSDSNKSLNTAGVTAAVPGVKRTPSLGGAETAAVQLRRGSREDLVTERSSKPAIPERPASLKPGGGEILLQKTQCSLSNVAPKQTPSLVQLSHVRGGGHDTQMAEKEKFLGHQPLQGDVNSNCHENNSRYRTQSVGKKPERPPKPEQIQLNTNGNINKATSHVRTRSDGNLIDIGQMEERGSPTSPRCTTKPQQPPPPPPTIIRNSSDSTDL